MCSAKCHVRVPLSIFFCILADAMHHTIHIVLDICEMKWNEMKCMFNMSFNLYVHAEFVFQGVHTMRCGDCVNFNHRQKWFRWQNRLDHRKFIWPWNNGTALLVSFLQSFTSSFRYSFSHLCHPVLPIHLLAPLLFALLACSHQFVKNWHVTGMKFFTIEDEWQLRTEDSKPYKKCQQ